MERAELIKQIERVIVACLRKHHWPVLGLNQEQWALFSRDSPPEADGKCRYRDFALVPLESLRQDQEYKDDPFGEAHGISYIYMDLRELGINIDLSRLKDDRFATEEEQRIEGEKARAKLEAWKKTPEGKEIRAATELFFALQKHKQLPPAEVAFALGCAESELLAQLRKHRDIGINLLPEYYQKYVDNEKDGAGDQGPGSGGNA